MPELLLNEISASTTISTMCTSMLTKNGGADFIADSVMSGGTSSPGTTGTTIFVGCEGSCGAGAAKSGADLAFALPRAVPADGVGVWTTATGVKTGAGMTTGTGPTGSLLIFGAA